jgi:hypothetical protein
MSKILNLFIDELGSASPKAVSSKLYILSGVMIPSQCREELKIKADQIKFKYWGRTNIVFHSREIGRKEGDYSILKDEHVHRDFTKDLMRFMDQSCFQLIGVIVDKEKMPKSWNEKTVYKKTSSAIIKNFALALLAQRNCKGRLIIESATSEKDFYYHKASSRYLSIGIKDLKVSFKDIQKVFTEISFVTKKNQDIEEQLADLLAYGFKLKYEKKLKWELSEYETKLLNVLERKLFKMNPNTGIVKKRLYSKIDSFKIFP